MNVWITGALRFHPLMVKTSLWASWNSECVTIHHCLLSEIVSHNCALCENVKSKPKTIITPSVKARESTDTEGINRQGTNRGPDQRIRMNNIAEEKRRKMTSTCDRYNEATSNDRTIVYSVHVYCISHTHIHTHRFPCHSTSTGWRLKYSKYLIWMIKAKLATKKGQWILK